MDVELERDGDGQLVPAEPLYLWYSERDTPSAKRFGPQYVQPDLWRCREHPDWQGEDIRETQLAKWGGPTFFPDKTEVERRTIWEEESIQAHAAVHGYLIRDR